MPAQSSTCSVPDCPSPSIKRGMCNAHYLYWVRRADPSEKRTAPQPSEQRTCLQCDKPFKANPSDLRRGRRFCSRACWYEANTRPVQGRFDEKVETAPGYWWNDIQCADWTGTLNQKGYGGFYANGRPREVHRVAWELAHGPIPAGLSVLHHCDRPCCVRVEHLFLGTQADNVADMDAKGRRVNAPLRGEQNANAKLSAEDVRAIRVALANGEPTASIAARYSVVVQTIRNVAHGINYGHVV